MVTAGSLKKVQFYAALALMLMLMLVLGAARAEASELISMAEVQRELTEKMDAVVLRQLQECREKERKREREERSIPYPVRIAQQKPVNHGLSAPLVGVQLNP